LNLRGLNKNTIQIDITVQYISIFTFSMKYYTNVSQFRCFKFEHIIVVCKQGLLYTGYTSYK